MMDEKVSGVNQQEVAAEQEQVAEQQPVVAQGADRAQGTVSEQRADTTQNVAPEQHSEDVQNNQDVQSNENAQSTASVQEATAPTPAVDGSLQKGEKSILSAKVESQDGATAHKEPLFSDIKSSIVAGVLGIFLGIAGAHDWYLGDKRRGMTHVALMGAGMIIVVIASMVAGAATLAKIPLVGVLTGFLSIIGWFMLTASSVWGLIDGATILIHGDAGLAEKGYMVAKAA